MDHCVDQHSQHHMLQMHGHGQVPPGMHMQMMSGPVGVPPGMQCMQPDMMNMNMPMDRKSPNDAPVAAPAKKRKKSSPRAQATTPVQSMNPAMMMPGQMDPGMMMNREPAPSIVAQNPFDDFVDPSGGLPQQHQQSNSMRMSHPQMQPQTRMFPPGHHPGAPMGFAQSPHMLSHSPNVNVQQIHHQMEMRNMAAQHAQARMGHPDASGSTVYPDEKCMIFNPQNPNAPPIYPCGRCHKEVHENDQAIFCESGCNFWFHRSCTGLTDQAYHLLVNEIFAEWACDGCCTRQHIPGVKIKP